LNFDGGLESNVAEYAIANSFYSGNHSPQIDLQSNIQVSDCVVVVGSLISVSIERALGMLRSHHQHDQHDLFVCLMALCAMREVLVPQNPLGGRGAKKHDFVA
jgi:hypothetical protein